MKHLRKNPDMVAIKGMTDASILLSRMAADESGDYNLPGAWVLHRAFIHVCDTRKQLMWED